YLRALAAMYIHMMFCAVEVYEILELLMKDYRKLHYRDMAGYSLVFFDEFIYQLLNDKHVCDIILPHLPKQQILEESGELGLCKSRLLEAM
ncbi:Pre-mRNA-splicing factor 38, partial [Pisolithus microcarpus]